MAERAFRHRYAYEIVRTHDRIAAIRKFSGNEFHFCFRQDAFRRMRMVTIFATALIASLNPAIARVSDAEQTAVAATPHCMGAADGIRLDLSVEGVRNGKGNITVSVYGDRPEDFLAKGKKLVKVRLPASPGTVQGCVMLPKEGVYAVAAYHDEDGDRRFTRTMIGLPGEGYAFSNDPALFLGPPSFSAAAFTATARGNPLHLYMHYP